jgi:hypothetical protein
MMSMQAATVETARACGSCTMCCKVLGIDDLKKPAGRWCVNARAGVGCVIHDERPSVCRSFQCMWLTARDLPDEWKPDRARFVLAVETSGCLQVICDPAQPAAWRREPYQSQIRRWAEHGMNIQKPVLLMIGDRASVVLPNTELPIGELKPGDEVEIAHDGMRFHARVRKAGA